MIYSVQLLTKTGLVELFEGFDNDLQSCMTKALFSNIMTFVQSFQSKSFTPAYLHYSYTYRHH